MRSGSVEGCSITHGKHELYIIDWEFAQISHPAHDLGQFIGDLYERWHFLEAAARSDLSKSLCLSMVKEFVKGYGRISDVAAFRVAFHAGVRLLNWSRRGRPVVPRRTVAEAMSFGREVILRGVKRDKSWFKSSALSCLFPECSGEM